jgi:nucleoside-triphosphatase THEP1
MTKVGYEEYLVLPEVVVEQKVPKLSLVKKPDVSMLNKLQKDIFDKITQIELGKFSQTLLTGYSGTGKSFLVTKIIEELISRNRYVNIAITAPTNKAVRVLKNLSSICETHSQVQFNTLHSLLGLKRVITYDGREEFKADYGDGGISDYDIIIVDEVSMLDNLLYRQLLDTAQYGKKMLLFIGDRGQIPPVNGGESLLFTMDLKNNFNLEDIIRQASGNPIIKIAQLVRTNKSFPHETQVDEDGNGVIFLKINTETKLLDTYFKSKNFEVNPNFVKVLAYTNNAVDYYNNKVRGLVYGEKCPRLNIGEKMVCNKPITDSKNKVILNNNDEFEVLSHVLKTDRTKLKLSYYEVSVMSDSKPYVIKVLGEKSEPTYEKELARLKRAAENASIMKRRNEWVKYFRFMGKFANVKYNYALTVHKSQGSTFDNVIVINCDINRMFDKIERNKLLYTAMTRAKNKLFMI